MCLLCVEEAGIALSTLYVVFPFLRSVVTDWKRRRRFKAMHRRSMLGRWV